MNFVTNVSFIIPYKGIAFVSETPTKIHWQDKRLHSVVGAAVKYADGYSLYAIKGVCFEKELFEKITQGELTKEDWLNEKNLEKRRILQDFMPDLVAMLDAREIDLVVD